MATTVLGEQRAHPAAHGEKSGLWSWIEAMRPRSVARNSQRMALPKKKSTGPRAAASIAARSAAGNSAERAAAVVGVDVDAGASAIIARNSLSDCWETAWLQAVTLHRRSRALHKELKEAEAELARDGTAESLARLIEIQKQLSSAEGMEAVADGFGQSSGRAARDI